MDKKMKILVIEDELDLLRLLEVRLEKQGYSVELARTGEEGIKKAKGIFPSVILLDLMMPGMDGFEVARQLKLDPNTQRIPLVALTALGEQEAIQRALKMGFAGYVVKPFDTETLLATIAEAISQKKH